MNAQLKQKAQEMYSRWRSSEVKAKVEGLGEDVVHAFVEHPKATGETYLQHLWFTIRMGGRMFWAGFAIMVHGFFPFLFTKTGSHEIEPLYAIMKNRIPASKLLESYEHFQASNI